MTKAAKYISSDDPGELLLSCVNRLKEGASLILFPEGTRSVVGQELNFKLGAAAVATRSDTQILPVLINCSQEGFLAKDVPWYKAPPERPFISVQILAPIRHQIIPGVEINSRQESRDLNAELLSFYQKHLNHNNYS